MSEKTLELKPCPFCGGEAELRESTKCHDTWLVRCQLCEIKTTTSYTKEEPISEWNTRTSSLAQEPVTTEPVAWQWWTKIGLINMTSSRSEAESWRTKGADVRPLYAIPAPPQPGRDAVIEECLKAARDGFEDAMKNYVLIGPSGMAMQMINSIKALKEASK